MDYQSLHMKTVADLRKLAKTMGVRLPAGVKKEQIIDRLLEAEVGGVQTSPAETEPADQLKRRGRSSRAQATPAPVEAPAEAEPVPEPQPEPEHAQEAPAQKETEIKETEPEKTENAETEKAEETSGEKPQEGTERRFTPQPRLYNSSMPRPRMGYNNRPMMNNAQFQRNTGDGQNRFRTNNNSRFIPRNNTVQTQAGSNSESNTTNTTEYQESGSARGRREGYYNAEYKTSNPAVPEMLTSGECADGAGVLEIQPDGYGFLRAENCLPGPNDVYVSIAQIRRFNLRMGDYVEGKTRAQREGDRYSAMLYITSINGRPPEETGTRTRFEDLVPIYPDERLRLEGPTSIGTGDLSLRLVDMLAPIGKGQRGMIVSQPKAGKTTLLKKIANAITAGYPEVKLIVMLIDERPEEVTDMKRSINGEVIYSTFDEAPENHVRVSEMVLERAQRLVEMGQDVVVLMDSITRLARAYNLTITPTGRSLSGGLDPGALFKPKRFFGAARNIENGGSLTVIATALVDTGSRMDDIIFEEFKGTGNMELHLDRKLSDKRVFPAIDMVRSGTRREELLLSEAELDGEMLVRRIVSGGRAQEMAEQVISLMSKTSTNLEFFDKLRGWLAVFEKDGYTLGNKQPTT